VADFPLPDDAPFRVVKVLVPTLERCNLSPERSKACHSFAGESFLLVKLLRAFAEPEASQHPVLWLGSLRAGSPATLTSDRYSMGLDLHFQRDAHSLPVAKCAATLSADAASALVTSSLICARRFVRASEPRRRGVARRADNMSECRIGVSARPLVSPYHS
jgi:hypothetical protein